MSDFFKGLVQHKQNMELIKGLQDLTASEAIAEDALKEIASLKQQLAEAQRDAERYRWLRDNGHLNIWWSLDGPTDRRENIDADIDKTMKGE